MVLKSLNTDSGEIIKVFNEAHQLYTKNNAKMSIQSNFL